MKLEGKISLVSRADKLDARDVRDMLDSPAWGLFVQKVDGMIAAAARKLESCTADQLPDLQAEVRVLRRVLTLPETIIAEVNERLSGR